jgi:hypothetical protein
MKGKIEAGNYQAVQANIDFVRTMRSPQPDHALVISNRLSSVTGDLRGHVCVRLRPVWSIVSPMSVLSVALSQTPTTLGVKVGFERDLE